MAKVSILLAVFLAGAASAAGPVDANDIVRRSIAAEIENAKRARNYTFIQRDEEREFDESGKVKSTESKTYDVTMLEGSAYRRLIARDDHPLPPKEVKKEDEKLNKSIVERRHESKSQREKRLSDYDDRPGRNRSMLKEVSEAFDFRLLREETVGSRPVYVVEGTPRPDYHGRNAEARLLLPKLKLTAWIDKRDLSWTRVHAEVINDVAWGLCLFKLAKGAQLDMEQVHINDEVWFPRVLRMKGSARVVIKRVNIEQELTFKDFRRFQSDSQIISTSEVR